MNKNPWMDKDAIGAKLISLSMEKFLIKKFLSYKFRNCNYYNYILQ